MGRLEGLVNRWYTMAVKKEGNLASEGYCVFTCRYRCGQKA